MHQWKIDLVNTQFLRRADPDIGGVHGLPGTCKQGVYRMRLVAVVNRKRYSVRCVIQINK